MVGHARHTKKKAPDSPGLSAFAIFVPYGTRLAGDPNCPGVQEGAAFKTQFPFS